ncbi:Phage Tail Collar Domain protein [Pseudoalteromonas sp. P1-9]|uniref:phage tail protein n=1 Tax=Pseudoalteromonas sp. P1-9 TaxID=1710354 RepID=UPI0006D60FE0|nr:tail fiber protein [Pseudoalteromonas sp. P1-9]KPV93697.1 Phage Tail Collar Domain protein [Pseudoalteromonas sp. P1-9]
MDPLLGQIMLFAGNFAPRGWAFCDGQLLAISQNSALFSILGTTYGGDGRTTFALPDLRGRVAVHEGNGPGLSPYRLGEKGGVEDVTLNTLQIPSHSHIAGSVSLPVSSSEATSSNPVDHVLASAMTNISRETAVSTNVYADADMANSNMKTAGSTGATGGSQSHTNVQPYLATNYIIAVQGTFPSRN